MEHRHEIRILKNEDRKYLINPSIELVGYLLTETKRTIKTNKVRIGIVDGKLTKISTDDRQFVYQDNSKFVKFYLDSDSLMEFSELSTSAQKMISYLIKNMEYGKDFVYLYNYKMIKEVGLSDTSISLAKNELVEKEWLFKSEETHKYWINLCYFCIGDREEIYRRYKNTQM